LEIATGGYFLYKEKLYCQIDGVTMGSPLGPTLANFFLAHLEEKFLAEKASSFFPELYVRYVDDIFAVFDSVEMVSKFLQFLNNFHPNLTFTRELGDNELAFLDTKVRLPCVDHASVLTTVYRKPTNTDVILNFSAVCPIQWKTGLITCFLNRAYLVCSDWSLFHEEINKLREIFCRNAYPRSIFDHCVGKFLSKKFDTTRILTENEDSTEKHIVLCLPYVGFASENFKRQIKNVFRDIGVKTRVVFRSFRVRNYFSLKDKTPLCLRSKVVYKFEGSCDKSVSYIGKTKRHLVTRFKEHVKGNSAIFDHVGSCQHCKNCNIGNFSILSSGRSDYEIKIKEALYIKYEKPSLNNNILHNGSQFLLHVF
jgi:hypothetical protein